MITKEMLHNRIRAMFAMLAIGDALGAPQEIMTASEIKKRYGRITTFVDNPTHKFGPVQKGETTDDTQLTLAIARSIARTGNIDPDDIAREHVAELDRTTRGWGGTTKSAAKALRDGLHHSVSGVGPSKDGSMRGKGNGVAMKIAPLGAYFAANNMGPTLNWDSRTAIKNVSLMTHATAMGVASGFAQVAAIHYLLTTELLDNRGFTSAVLNAAILAEFSLPWDLPTERSDRLSARFRELASVDETTEDNVLREKFGNGDCYVFESLPLAYALFLRKPYSLDALYDAVNWGGDTDTVGAIVGSLLGAFNGTAIVPPDLWDGVDRKDEIIQTAELFISAIAC
jgi:ADP-ribosylglycohydrolase